MAANVILSNGDMEYDVASDMDPRKSDVAGHVNIHVSGFFSHIDVREYVTRNIVVLSKTSQEDVEMSRLMSVITRPWF